MCNSHVLDNNKIVLGQCVRVTNVEKKRTPNKHKFESDEYIAIQIEDYDGKDERCILFTPTEHTDMETVGMNYAMLNNMVAGRLYHVTINKVQTYLLKVFHWDGRSRVLRIASTSLQKAVERAEKHPLSCTKKSILTDLFD